MLRCNIQTLHITLRLPLQVSQVLDGDQDMSQDHVATASLWTNMWPAVSVLSGLRKIEIEIDHLDPSSWSLVNERVILSPIAELGKNAPHLAIIVLMPHLHPLYEDHNRHLINDETQPSFAISRRVRQKYHYGEDSNGQCLISKSRHDTFPAWTLMMDILHEYMLEMQAAGLADDYIPEPAASRQEREDQERADWKQGVDVMEKVDQLGKDLFWFEPCLG